MARIQPAAIRSWFSEMLSVQGIIFIIGKICLVLAAWFGGSLGADAFEAKRSQLIPDIPPAIDDNSSNLKKPSLESYNIISSRNIFGVVGKKPVAVKTDPVTELKLRLVATHLAGDTSFAIIEDTQKKEQDVFDLTSNVFGQATLVEILAESVRLERGTSIETLIMEEAVGGTSGGSGEDIEVSDDETEFTVPEEELEDALANLPKLLSQARAVPFFRAGKSIGMRLFAIRRGSLYEKLGLKNGDILLSVNDNSLSDPSQALKIFEQLKNEKAIAVLVERKGEEMDLKYSIR